MLLSLHAEHRPVGGAMADNEDVRKQDGSQWFIPSLVNVIKLKGLPNDTIRLRDIIFADAAVASTSVRFLCRTNRASYRYCRLPTNK